MDNQQAKEVLRRIHKEGFLYTRPIFADGCKALTHAIQAIEDNEKLRSDLLNCKASSKPMLDRIVELQAEVERLKEYEWKYKELCK